MNDVFQRATKLEINAVPYWPKRLNPEDIDWFVHPEQPYPDATQHLLVDREVDNCVAILLRNADADARLNSRIVTLAVRTLEDLRTYGVSGTSGSLSEKST